MKFPALGILALSALGVSAVCAATVFLFLVTGERHADTASNRDAAAYNTPRTTAKSSTAIDAVQPDHAVAPNNSKAAPVEFQRTDFSLIKSRSYRAAGPVRIRLLRTKNNRTCDLAVLVANQPARRLGTTIGAPVEVRLPGSGSRATLVVTRIANNRVWGFLMAQKSQLKTSAGAHSRRKPVRKRA